MAHRSVLAGYAHPYPILMNPSVCEAAPALVWLGLVRSSYAVESRHDRGVALDACVH